MSRPHRSPTHPDNLPPFTEMLSLARAVARRKARRPDDVDDLIQEGMLALWTRYYEEDRGKAFHPLTSLRVAVKEFYRTARSGTPGDGPEERFPEPEAVSAPPPAEPDVLGEFLRDLEAEVGEEHAWVAENLFAPTDELGVWVLREMRRKAAALEEDPDLDLRGVETARVSHRLIREALGWTPGRWGDVLGEIRAFARAWMTRRGMAAPPP